MKRDHPLVATSRIAGREGSRSLAPGASHCPPDCRKNCSLRGEEEIHNSHVNSRIQGSGKEREGGEERRGEGMGRNGKGRKGEKGEKEGGGE